MRIDLTNGETLWLQGESVMIGNEFSNNEDDCVYMERAVEVANGELMSKVKRLKLELTGALTELKAMAVK